jgi:3-hydroxyisobutyrate dehydrogenase
MVGGGLFSIGARQHHSLTPTDFATKEPDMTPNHIAFLGLGAMGQRMAARLLAAGHRVSVWNRSPGPAAALQAQGATLAASPREAAQGADVVISMVFDDAASRRVWLDPMDGAALGLSAQAFAVECSTLSPLWVAELAAALPVPLVDAPVAGSRLQAESGQLIFMAGGSPDAVARVQPLLLAMGGTVHPVGASGSGAWLKLAVNSLFATQVAAMAELLALLRGAGLDPAPLIATLKTMPVTSPAAAGAASLMLAGREPPGPAPVPNRRRALPGRAQRRLRCREPRRCSQALRLTPSTWRFP